MSEIHELKPASNLARPKMLRQTRLLALKASSLLFVLAFTILSGTQTQAQTPGEYQVKAAFLFNFVKFVEWPAEAFADSNAPLVIGVLGDDPFGSALDQTISGKNINGRQLVIRRLKWGQDLRGCHVLFISSSERNRLSQIIQSLRGASVLTVGETGQFNQQGGIINFVLDASKVRFEINTGVAEQAHLKISSRLMSLAKNVRK